MKRGVSFSGAHLVVARQTPVTRQELLQKFVRSDPRQQVLAATCLLPPACHLPPATCLPPPASRLPPVSRLPPPASKQRSAGTRRTFPTLSPLCAGAASYAFIDAAARIYLLVTVAILTVAPLPTDCGYNCYFPWLYLLWLYSPSL